MYLAIHSSRAKRGDRLRICVVKCTFYSITKTTFAMANLYFIVPVLLLAFFVQDGEPVRCYTCSSDLHPMCNDPFHVDHYDSSGYGQQPRLENCDAHAGATYPYLTSSKSACKKQKKYINGQMVISRGCTWKRQDDWTNNCPYSNNGPNEVSSFCETCDYDSCNGAATITKSLAFIVAPLGYLLFK